MARNAMSLRVLFSATLLALTTSFAARAFATEILAQSARDNHDPVVCFDHAMRDAINAVQAYSIVFSAAWKEEVACHGKVATADLESCWAPVLQARSLLEKVGDLSERAARGNAAQQPQLLNKARGFNNQAAGLLRQAQKCFQPISARWTQAGGRYVPNTQHLTLPGGIEKDIPLNPQGSAPIPPDATAERFELGARQNARGEQSGRYADPRMLGPSPSSGQQRGSVTAQPPAPVPDSLRSKPGTLTFPNDATRHLSLEQNRELMADPERDKQHGFKVGCVHARPNELIFITISNAHPNGWSTVNYKRLYPAGKLWKAVHGYVDRSNRYGGQSFVVDGLLSPPNTIDDTRYAVRLHDKMPSDCQTSAAAMIR